MWCGMRGDVIGSDEAFSGQETGSEQTGPTAEGASSVRAGGTSYMGSRLWGAAIWAHSPPTLDFLTFCAIVGLAWVWRSMFGQFLALFSKGGLC